MSAPRVRGGSASGQATEHLLGGWPETDQNPPFRLYVTGQSGAVLRRPRAINTDIDDIAATVAHGSGVVHRIVWDDHHRTHLTPTTRKQIAHWIRALIAADWASSA
ncbi:hypothetical protein GCM10027447_31950 [Glycomyces halotolerans]